MKVIIVRHGDTLVSADEIVQSVNNELSALGKEQACKVAQKLEDYTFDVIVSSTLPRAVDTANIINTKFNKNIIFTKNLVEVKWPSKLEGEFLDNPQVIEYRTLRNDKNTTDVNWHYADEENFIDLKVRAQALFQELINLKVENILAVTHSTYMKVLVSVMCHGPDVTWTTYYDFLTFAKPKHTSISVFELDLKGKWHMDFWNL